MRQNNRFPWQIFVVVALVGAAANANVFCNDRLGAQLINKTRFVDVKAVRAKPLKALKNELARYQSFLPELDAGFAKADEQNFNAFEAALRGVHEYMDLLARAIGEKGAAEMPGPLALSVDKKSSRQLIREIAAIAYLKTASPVIRYFPVARQDVMLEHGTDRFGTDPGAAWDLFGLEGLLAHLNLKSDDGFYALSFLNAYDKDFDKEGPGAPYIMINNFMAGERAVAIYDGEQLTTDDGLDDGDMFIFKNPAAKTRALMAVIRPTRK